MAKKVSHSGGIHGTDLEPREADRFVVVQAVQFDDGVAAGKTNVLVFKAHATVLPDDVAQPVHGDVTCAARTGDPGGVHACIDQRHPFVELVLHPLNIVA
ncbi:hypothetical protein GCM10009827_118930 [Dactylosporangium maewongense]|uniref:Uncharacterized protein n=1 Tax=Dactylosporangium maewongense TaxID=634393 RepID=A0ABP4PB51_9ACTN